MQVLSLNTILRFISKFLSERIRGGPGICYETSCLQLHLLHFLSRPAQSMAPYFQKEFVNILYL